MSIAIVLSTYEWPEGLDAALAAFADQSDQDFELTVADDGSGPATREVIERWQGVLGDRLGHVWQPDQGFRVAAARNRGALATGAGYLVFLDGDCVPRRHFVRAMRAAARPGWFVSANRLKLSRELTERVLRESIPIQRWSAPRLLLATRGGGSAFATLTPRDRRRVGRTSVPEFAPHEDAYCCIGVARTDFEAVNGYDMRYVSWGDEDVDLAVRLRRLGLRCGHAGPGATPLHLWHQSRAVLDRPNWWLRQETEQSGRLEALEGLRELAAGVPSPNARARRG